jgi:hypothetical protein
MVILIIVSANESVEFPKSHWKDPPLDTSTGIPPSCLEGVPIVGLIFSNLEVLLRFYVKPSPATHRFPILENGANSS